MRTQPCDPVRKLYVFTVAGWGEFPIDMLRYDSCWPHRESEDSVAIGASHFPRASTVMRQVTLIGIKAPTEGRWKSFGWSVLQ